MNMSYAEGAFAENSLVISCVPPRAASSASEASILPTTYVSLGW